MQWPGAFANVWCCDARAYNGAQVNYPEFAACLLVLGLAAFAQGVFGLGFAMIATPLLALFLDYQTAIFTTAVPLFALAGYWLLSNRKTLRLSGIPWALLPGIGAGAVIGVALQVSLPQRVSLLLLATLIVFSILLPFALSLWIPKNRTFTPRSAPLLGVLAGVTESALNVGAPFIVLYAGLARLTRLQLLICLNLCFALGKAIQLSLLMMVAPVPVSWHILLASVLICLLAFRLGDGLAGKFKEEGFQALLRIFLLAMAAMLVVRSQLVS